MKKTANIIFILICLVLCIIPFAGMTVARTDTTTENRRMAEFPQTKKDGKINVDYMSELGAWFEDHFAFRPQLVMTDSLIQSKVFGTSNMDTVIVGRNGWLYYTSTLPDYLGTETLSEQGLDNAVRNLAITQRIVEERGASFLLTVPPNKNSLYDDNMPYYDSHIVDKISNIDLIAPKLIDNSINYTDLFEVFNSEQETLYMKRDSHWNGKGAVIAYNAILDSLSFDHETYETVPVLRTKNAYGDLNKMIYPIPYAPEWDYDYNVDGKALEYSYVTDTESVEDAWIETVNESGNGSLLMFRDSFGNTLLPLMAGSFEHAYFSKMTPYNLGDLMDEHNPEYVIIEKVERNIGDFAKEPPIVTGPEVMMLPEASGTTATDTETAGIVIAECENNTDYWQFSGNIGTSLKPESRVCVVFTNADNKSKGYEAFTVSGDISESEYLLYVNKKLLSNEEVRVEVWIDNNDVMTEVGNTSFNPSLIVN